MKKIIAIVGPTASGKTDLSLFLAKKFDGYIISADSKQLYKGMDIGTGKITEKEAGTIPHFGFDLINPDQEFNVSHFKKYAERIIDSKDEVAIVVGGTGLFIDALLYNITPPEVAPDLEFRTKIEEQIQKESLEAVVKELIALDPEAENIVDLKNPRRVIRALEVTKKSGKPFSAYYTRGPQKYESLVLGIDIPKEELHTKIDTRVDAMINDGLIGEVKNLLKKYNKNAPGFSSIGYKELIPYLKGEISKEQTIEDIKTASKKYAKRQMTWFRGNKNVQWASTKEEAEKITKNFLS